MKITIIKEHDIQTWNKILSQVACSIAHITVSNILNNTVLNTLSEIPEQLHQEIEKGIK